MTASHHGPSLHADAWHGGFGFFNDAFNVNLIMDLRKADQLVCPTCMMVHLPVEGTKKIAIPKKEMEEGEQEVAAASAGEDGEAAAVGERGMDSSPLIVI